jgi:hypothetical protein
MRNHGHSIGVEAGADDAVGSNRVRHGYSVLNGWYFTDTRHCTRHWQLVRTDGVRVSMLCVAEFWIHHRPGWKRHYLLIVDA